jgi:protein-tyrosine kinase
MSLIEKAVLKLDQQGDAPRQERVAPGGALPSSTIEQGMRLGVPGEPAFPASPDLAPPAAAPTAHPLHANDDVRGINVNVVIEGLRERGMVTPDGSNIGLSSEFRVIKRPILDNAFPKKGPAKMPRANTVMVTSSVPGEGKSFCAMNLAISIAMERDHRVLLIDADVHRPNVMKTMGVEDQLEGQPGLIDIVLDPSRDVGGCIHSTNIEKLYVMPVGSRHSHPTELFSSNAMEERIDFLSSRFPETLFIFDCCPLLATTEARVLAPRMGQVVMVVEADRTPRDRVRESLACIEGANVIGLVLNKSRAKNSGEYYGYYYAA